MAKRANEYRTQGKNQAERELYANVRAYLEDFQGGGRYLAAVGQPLDGRYGPYEVKQLLTEIFNDLREKEQRIAELEARTDKLRQFEAAQSNLVSALGKLLTVGRPVEVDRVVTYGTILLRSLGGCATNKIQAIKAVREVTNLGLKEAKDVVDSVAGGQSQELHLYTASKDQHERALWLLRSHGMVVE